MWLRNEAKYIQSTEECDVVLSTYYFTLFLPYDGFSLVVEQDKDACLGLILVHLCKHDCIWMVPKSVTVPASHDNDDRSHNKSCPGGMIHPFI